MNVADTIFALSSGRPPAAIAILRISGPQAHAAAALVTGELPPPRVASVRELRSPATGELLDEALVLRFDAPASATGDDLVEFHCHGGRAVVDCVLAALTDVGGLRAAEPGEFTRRAFDNARIDLTEAEGLADLLEAETESQRKAALAIAEGGLRRQIEQWQQRVLALSAAVERAIDYDEADEALDAELLRACDVLASELGEWLARPRVERLKDGLLVVAAGPPNAGKSSLINAIVGEDRSIVSDLPGTTRDHVEVPLALGGLPVRLTDTAGLRDTDDPVETIGVERAFRLAASADILLWLGEEAHAPEHPRLILLHPKADLGVSAPARGAIAVSAVTGQGITELLGRVSDVAKEIMPRDSAMALNRRQADLLGAARASLHLAASAADYPILGEELRQARGAFDRLTGRAGIDDLLDVLFSRFCLGK